jgi:Putative SAM-dependent methyltransferase
MILMLLLSGLSSWAGLVVALSAAAAEASAAFVVPPPFPPWQRRRRGSGPAGRIPRQQQQQQQQQQPQKLEPLASADAPSRRAGSNSEPSSSSSSPMGSIGSDLLATATPTTTVGKGAHAVDPPPDRGSVKDEEAAAIAAIAEGEAAEAAIVDADMAPSAPRKEAAAAAAAAVSAACVVVVVVGDAPPIPGMPPLAVVDDDDDGGALPTTTTRQPQKEENKGVSAAARRLARRLGLPLVVVPEDDDEVDANDDDDKAGGTYTHALRYVPWRTMGRAAAAASPMMTKHTIDTTGRTMAAPSSNGGGSLLPKGSAEEYALEIRCLVPPNSSTTRRRQKRARPASAFADDDGAGLSMVVDWVQLLYGPGGGAGAGGDVEYGKQQPATPRASRPGKDRLVQAVLGGVGRSRNRMRNRDAGRAGDLGTAEDDDDDDDNMFRIVDLTAGWGTDALTLLQAAALRSKEAACRCCHVTLVERDPIVRALLQDAHRRLQKYEAAVIPAAAGQPTTYSSQIDLVEGDGVEVAAHFADRPSSAAPGQGRPDAVYLDPMFPPRTKSAAVKKPMQVLHSLLHTHVPKFTADASDNSDTSSGRNQEDADDDGLDLLEAALRLATQRVVVKRPIKAEPLGRKAPNYALTGGAHRWDLYIITSPSSSLSSS